MRYKNSRLTYFRPTCIMYGYLLADLLEVLYIIYHIIFKTSCRYKYKMAVPDACVSSSSLIGATYASYGSKSHKISREVNYVHTGRPNRIILFAFIILSQNVQRCANRHINI